MIIDSHLHIDLRGYTEQKLLDHLKRHSIDKAWLLSWEEGNPQFKTYSNVAYERILEICSRHPDKFIPFYAPDPTWGDLEEKLKKLNYGGFAGAGELKVAVKWEDDAIGKLLTGLKKKVLVFHMQDKRYYSSTISVRQKLLRDYKNGRFKGLTKTIIGKIAGSEMFRGEENKLMFFQGYLPDFDGLEKRLRQFPEINFVAHGWLFWSHISDDYTLYKNIDKRKIRQKGIIWDLLEKHPNLYCDTSAGSGWNALTRDRKKAREFLETFWQKILFGTDNSGFDFVNLIKGYRLPKEKEEAVFYGNSEKVLQ